METIDEIGFTDSEHLGGQHKTFQNGCYECASENRLKKSYRIVNIPKIEMLPKNWARDVMNKIIWGDSKHFYD